MRIEKLLSNLGGFYSYSFKIISDQLGAVLHSNQRHNLVNLEKTGVLWTNIIILKYTPLMLLYNGENI